MKIVPGRGMQMSVLTVLCRILLMITVRIIGYPFVLQAYSLVQCSIRESFFMISVGNELQGTSLPLSRCRRTCTCLKNAGPNGSIDIHNIHDRAFSVLNYDCELNLRFVYISVMRTRPKTSVPKGLAVRLRNCVGRIFIFIPS